MKIKFLTAFLAAFAFFFVFANCAKASEGTIDMKSQTSEPYRCWASSVKQQNKEYKILFTCRYLIYPVVDDNFFYYIMWATPTSGKNPVKLGVLGYGSGEFKTKTAFSALYITTESNKNTSKPTGVTVMKGSVESISFLEQAPSPTPTSAVQTPQEEGQEITATPTPTQELTTKDKLLLAFKRAGIVAGIALVVLIGLVFVVSRSRR